MRVGIMALLWPSECPLRRMAILAGCMLLVVDAGARGGDPMVAFNTALNVVNTTINVVTFAQQVIDERNQTRAQGDIAVAEYWHRRVEGHWFDGKMIVGRTLWYHYMKPSLAALPQARWVVCGGDGRILDQGTNLLPVRIALRDTSCTNSPRSGVWCTDKEGYVLVGIARMIRNGEQTVRNPAIQEDSFDITLTGLRHLLDPTNSCDGAEVTESLPPKRLTLKFSEPVFFRLESTNRPELRKAGASNYVMMVPRLVQNRVYDLPGTLLAGWNRRLSEPSLVDAPLLLGRAEAVGRAPGQVRDKATSAFRMTFENTYRDGLPAAQIMSAPRTGGMGAWDVRVPGNPDRPNE